jgi:benzoylformate decarboxylase
MSVTDGSITSVKQGLADVLAAREVQYIFGNPGSTELTFLAGLPSAVEYIMALQEASVGAMAAGYALRTGATPVISVHTAPGLGNVIGALHNIASSRLSAVVIVGQQDSRHLREDPALSGDLVGMARAVTKWAHEPTRAIDVPRAVEKAFRIAESGTPGPVLLSIPMDLFEGDGDRAPVTAIETGGGIGAAGGALAQELTEADSVALVCGARVELDGAWEAAIALADRVGATVYSAPFEPLPGFPTAHPRFAHALPFTATDIGRVLSRHTHVVVLGAPAVRVYPYSKGELVARGTRVTVISDIPSDLTGVALDNARLFASRIGPALADILEHLPAGDDGAGPTPASARPAGEPTDTSPVSVRDACGLVAAARPEGAVLVDESISSAPVVARVWKTTAPRSHLRSADGGLGFALPAAVGAALAGDAPAVVCMIGDGSLPYSPQALWTAAEHQLPVKVVVLSNGGYKVLADYHEHVSAHLGELPSMKIGHLNPTQIAQGFGVPARHVQSARELADELDWLYGEPGPALLDVAIEWSERSMFKR